MVRMGLGVAGLGAELVIKELHLERARKYGKDPMVMAKRLFTHYRRGLYIDTGVGDNDHPLEKAAQFCKDFDLALEKTAADSGILAEELNRCRKLKGEWRRRFCERGGRFRNG